jgi:signal transduction histidine kinase
MDHMDTSGMAGTAVPLPTTHKTTLTGWQLWLARLLWLFITGLVLLILSQLWPVNYWATYEEWVVTNTRPAVSTFMVYGDFVRFVSLLESLSTITALLMGFVIFWYRSDDKMGLFVSAFLILISPWYLSSNMDVWRLPLWVPFSSTLLSLVQAATIVTLVLFFYLFPDGRFVPQWTRWLAAFILLLLGTFVVGNIFNIPSPFGDLWLFYTTAVFISMLVAGGAQFYRYRSQTDPVQRQQMKWVVFAIMVFIVSILPAMLGVLGGSTIWGPVLELLLRMLAQLFIPLAIGFSILRYRLWEIDLLINRTLVYGVLTALVIGLYILVVGIAGSLFRFGDNTLAAVLATGLVAILFEPLRRRLQHSVNRLMYGEQDDPAALLRKLGQRLAETAVPTETIPNLVETIAKTLKLPYVAILAASEQWAANSEQWAVSGGRSVREQLEQVRFPLQYQNEMVGELVVSVRAVGERFSKTELKLLEDIARQAGTAVYAARLTADLQHTRERLIATREEERRRLRRDLHDGLGPQLATLTIKVSAAQNLLKSDPDTAARLLSEVKAESQNAIKEIRQVVEGLRPSALDQFGLLSALQEFVAQNGNGQTQISLHTPESLPPLPAAVEVATYRIATEAITNCLRHAHAQSCTMQLHINDNLCLDVRDDGVGLPVDGPPEAASGRSGVGLSSMRERAAELGGRCEIISEGNGVRVTAVLPL